MRRTDFDPLAYIENAFLDQEPKAKGIEEGVGDIDVALPQIGDYLNGKRKPKVVRGADQPKGRFRKTEMSAPRPRRARASKPPKPALDPAIQTLWEDLPKNIDFLMGFFDDSVTANYYRGEFKESREELVQRLLDPRLSLEEVSRLLGVCPATVRRYTNRGWLAHHRTQGGQRRFRLSDVVRFVQAHGRFPEE